MTGICCIVAAMLAGIDQPEANRDLTGVKCVVTGRQVGSEYSSKYKSGVVYFDCNNSRLKFDADPKWYATKANHQLVVTSQYFQSKCPVSQLEWVSSDHQLQIAGVQISCCCHRCLTQLKQIDDAKVLIERIFADRNFDSIFISNLKTNTPKPSVGLRK